MQWHLFCSQQQGILPGLLLSNLCLVVLEVARHLAIVCLLHIARRLRPGRQGTHPARFSADVDCIQYLRCLLQLAGAVSNVSCRQSLPSRPSRHSTELLQVRDANVITAHLMFFTAFLWTQSWPECSPMIGRSVRGIRGALRHIFLCLHCTARAPACTSLNLLQHHFRRSTRNLAVMLAVSDTWQQSGRTLSTFCMARMPAQEVLRPACDNSLGKAHGCKLLVLPSAEGELLIVQPPSILHSDHISVKVAKVPRRCTWMQRSGRTLDRYLGPREILTCGSETKLYTFSSAKSDGIPSDCWAVS